MIIEFEAAITDDQMYRGEKVAQSWGVTSRIALVVLTRSSSEFKDIGDLKWRERETELLKSAQARMLVVLESYSDEHPNHEAELVPRSNVLRFHGSKAQTGNENER